jgi:hypothetical protein
VAALEPGRAVMEKDVADFNQAVRDAGGPAIVVAPGKK